MGREKKIQREIQAMVRAADPAPPRPLRPEEVTNPHRFEEIKAFLLNEIVRGTYPPGSKLPSIRQIMSDWGCSDTTAKRALGEVVTAGWANAVDRVGYVATAGPMAAPGLPGYPHHTGPQPIHGTIPDPGPAAHPSTQATPAGTPQQAYSPPTGTLTTRPPHAIPADAPISPATTRIAAVNVRTEPAPPDVALALRLPDPTTPVIVRRRLITDPAGTPVELRASYLPTDLADGTLLVTPRPIDDPWPAALAQATGRTPTTATSRITARHPTDHEAAALGLALHAVVLTRDDTTTDRQGQPLDHTRSVWPADTTHLTNRYTVTTR